MSTEKNFSAVSFQMEIDVFLHNEQRNIVSKLKQKINSSLPIFSKKKYETFISNYSDHKHQ